MTKEKAIELVEQNKVNDINRAEVVAALEDDEDRWDSSACWGEDDWESSGC